MDLGDIPLLCLTARPSPQNEIVALALGADDYIVKPVHPGVLLARVQNALRHYDRQTGSRAHQGVLSVGDLTIDLREKTVRVAGRPVRLPPHAFHLLYALAARQGEVVLTDELLERVWGLKSPGEDTLYVHMRTLRERLEADPKCPQRIMTVYGVGYKLVPQGI